MAPFGTPVGQNPEQEPSAKAGARVEGWSAGHLLRGNAKGVGRIDQPTFIDRFSKVAFAKLYDRKIRLAAADLLNDRVLPFFEDYEIALSGPRLPQ